MANTHDNTPLRYSGNGARALAVWKCDLQAKLDAFHDEAARRKQFAEANAARRKAGQAIPDSEREFPSTSFATAKLVLMCMVDTAGNGDECWPSQPYLMTYVGCRKDAISAAVFFLEWAGFVSVRPRNNAEDPFERTNLYTIIWETIEAQPKLIDRVRAERKFRSDEGKSQGEPASCVTPEKPCRSPRKNLVAPPGSTAEIPPVEPSCTPRINRDKRSHLNDPIPTPPTPRGGAGASGGEGEDESDDGTADQAVAIFDAYPDNPSQMPAEDIRAIEQAIRWEAGQPDRIAPDEMLAAVKDLARKVASGKVQRAIFPRLWFDPGPNAGYRHAVLAKRRAAKQREAEARPRPGKTNGEVEQLRIEREQTIGKLAAIAPDEVERLREAAMANPLVSDEQRERWRIADWRSNVLLAGAMVLVLEQGIPEVAHA